MLGYSLKSLSLRYFALKRHMLSFVEIFLFRGFTENSITGFDGTIAILR